MSRGRVYRYVVGGMCLWSTCAVKGQVQMGMSPGNYNVTEAIRLNPAAAVDPKPYFDIHVVGVHALVDNNFMYFPKSRFNPIAGRYDLEPEFDTRTNLKHGQLQGAVSAFGFNYSIDKHAFGFMVANRHVASVRRVPFDLAENLIDDWDLTGQVGQPYEGSNFRINYLGWTEFAFHYGRIMYQQGFEMINATVRPKLLLGMSGSYLQIEQFDYLPVSTTNVVFTDITGRYAATDFGFNQGIGFGIDLGVEYKVMLESVNNYTPHSPKSDCKHIDYKHKFGVSILDFGAIPFRRGSEYRRLAGARGNWEDLSNMTPFGTEFAYELDAQFGDGVTERDTRYTAWLPTALSVQYDYNFENNFYLNVTGLYGVPRRRVFGAEAMEFVSVAPRFETQFFEASMPVSTNRFLRPHVGLALRLWFLQVGTDNLIPWVVGDAYRLDAYVNLKIPLTHSRRCDPTGLDRPFWRMKDCSDPESRKGKSAYKRSKSRNQQAKRNKRQQRKYSGNKRFSLGSLFLRSPNR